MAKQKFKITNWPTYNKALINRGSITFWLDDEAIQAWYESATPSSRGRPQRYSDLAITTVLVIKRVFRLTLRAAQGFIDSIFSLMNVPLRCPDYSCVSRRAKSVNISFKTPTRGEIAHLVIDSTGLKVFGEGEWKVKQNSLIGYGLVVGLDGTGDQTTQTPFTTQTLNNMLSQLGITVPTGTNMQLKNVAAVMVTASLPPFGRQGQTIDVVVSSMGNAKSLRGGTLLMTPLKGVDSQVYALAQGNILVGGAGTSAGGSSVQVNQLNGGRITNGAVIERELPSQFGVGNTLNLQLNDEDFSMAQQIADTINRVRGYGSATALDARTIQVRVPSGNSSQVRFLADIQNMQVNVTPQDAKVVINSRTGSVVMNREVTLDSCAVAQGNLSVTVNRQANVSQPDTPFGGGQTVVTPQTQIDLRQSGGSLQSVRSSASLNNVVRALNALGATPMDLMSILQSMQSAGCLRAKLEII